MPDVLRHSAKDAKQPKSFFDLGHDDAVEGDDSDEEVAHAQPASEIVPEPQYQPPQGVISARCQCLSSKLSWQHVFTVTQ